jgi:Protein of unknown function (DUF3365)
MSWTCSEGFRRRKEFVGRRDTPGGPELFISAPIRVDDKSCLICHGVAARAPPKLVKLYGINNGFDWKLNDVVDAQIMGVPAQVAQNRVLAAQNTIMVGWPAFSPLSGRSSTASSTFSTKGVNLPLPLPGNDESRLSLGCLGVRRHYPPPSTPFIARLVSCA